MNDEHIPASDAESIDLAHLDDEFGHAEVQEHEFEPVPDGKYQVIVEGAALTRAKSTGNPMLKWTLKILGPTHRGRLLWRNSVMASAENLKWLKTDLHICGVELAKLSDLPDRIEELLDIRLEVTKRTRGDSENVYFNRKIVTEDSPDDDLMERARQVF